MARPSARMIACATPASLTRAHFAVQATIDRIIFLRSARIGGIESYGELQHCAMDQHLCRLLTFTERRPADNSGLFIRRERGRAEAPDR